MKIKIKKKHYAQIFIVNYLCSLLTCVEKSLVTLNLLIEFVCLRLHMDKHVFVSTIVSIQLVTDVFFSSSFWTWSFIRSISSFDASRKSSWFITCKFVWRCLPPIQSNLISSRKFKNEWWTSTYSFVVFVVDQTTKFSLKSNSVHRPTTSNIISVRQWRWERC